MAVAAALAAAAVYVVVVPKSCERFIVISQQRSGSSYLVDALDGHPDLACADEIFAKRSGTDTGDWAAVDATWEAVFARACPRGWRPPRAVGFKWMTNQGHDALHDRVLAKARATHTRVIFLFRQNELRREISAAVNREVGGEAAGLAHPATAERAQLVRAHRATLRAGAALVNELARKYEERARVAAYYAEADRLFVDYEDLLGGGAGLARIRAFLGVAHVDAAAPRSRVLHQDGPILAAVENAAVVRETMARACAPPPPGRPQLTFGGACNEALGGGACACGDGPCPCESSDPDAAGAVLGPRALEAVRDRYAAARRTLAAAGDATAAGDEAEGQVSALRAAEVARDASGALRCEDSEDCGYFERCVHWLCVGATASEEQSATQGLAAAPAWTQRKRTSWFTSHSVLLKAAGGAGRETAAELARMSSLLQRQLQAGAYSYYFYEDDDTTYEVISGSAAFSGISYYDASAASAKAVFRDAIGSVADLSVDRVSLTRVAAAPLSTDVVVDFEISVTAAEEAAVDDSLQAAKDDLALLDTALAAAAAASAYGSLFASVKTESVDVATPAPTHGPAPRPSYEPTTLRPTEAPPPSYEPTYEPTKHPSAAPTVTPQPSSRPTPRPSSIPVPQPTAAPSRMPVPAPTTNIPPTLAPTYTDLAVKISATVAMVSSDSAADVWASDDKKQVLREGLAAGSACTQADMVELTAVNAATRRRRRLLASYDLSVAFDILVVAEAYGFDESEISALYDLFATNLTQHINSGSFNDAVIEAASDLGVTITVSAEPQVVDVSFVTVQITTPAWYTGAPSADPTSMPSVSPYPT